MMIAGDAERILSGVAVDPGVGIRRPVRRRDIRRGLQARLGVLVHGSRLLLAVHSMRPRIHAKPVRGAQGRDLRPAVGAGARLVLLVDQEEAGGRATSSRGRHVEDALAVVRATRRRSRRSQARRPRRRPDLHFTGDEGNVDLRRDISIGTSLRRYV